MSPLISKEPGCFYPLCLALCDACETFSEKFQSSR